MIVRLADASRASPLFAGWDEALLRACLQGVMGSVWAPHGAPSPASAVAVLGDFAFYAGVPDPALVRWRPPSNCGNAVLLIPRDPAWAHCIEQAGARMRTP